MILVILEIWHGLISYIVLAIIIIIQSGSLTIFTVNVILIVISFILEVEGHTVRILITEHYRFKEVHVHRHLIFAQLLSLVSHSFLELLAQFVS